jgi:hypothetical protein
MFAAELAARNLRGDTVYECKTPGCGETVKGLAAARRHAKQGHKTQRDAFHAGQLHSLELVPRAS